METTQTAAAMGVFTTDRDLVVRSWDDWLGMVSGIPPADACGRPLAAVIPDLTERGLLTRFQSVIESGVVEVLAPSFHGFLIRCAPRSPSAHFQEMQQHVTIAPIIQDHSIVGTLVTIEDVTARRDLERVLAEQLSDPDESVRLRAAEALAAGPSTEPVSPLVQALGDESWRVRRVAVDGLARQGTPEAVASLLRSLRREHMNLSVLNSALQTLAMMDLDTAAPLMGFLEDPDPELRTYAALALGEMQDPRAVGPLVRALEDPQPNVRYHAIEALGRLRAKEAVDALCGIVQSGDFYLAFPAIDALVRIGDPTVIDRILPLLENPFLCEPVIEALGELGQQEAAASLAALLNGSLGTVPAICRALARLYDRFQEKFGEGTCIADAVAAQVKGFGLERLLKSLEKVDSADLRPIALVLGWLRGEAVDRALTRLLGEPSVGKEVVEALVRHGSSVVELLMESLRADQVEVRKAAVIALGRIGDGRAVPGLVALLDDEPEMQVVACGALAKIGDRRAFEALLELLPHPQGTIRQAAVAALNSLGHPDMGERMEECLKSADPLLRESAVKIAGYFGYENCSDLLYACCRDPDERVRCAALEHIVYLEDENRACVELSQALASGPPRVRAAVVRALAHVSIPTALDLLVGAMEDEDPWVRYFAARSLARKPLAEDSEGWRRAFSLLAEHSRSDPAQPVRIAALRALGTLGGRKAIPYLIPVARQPERDLARAAWEALGAMEHPEAISELMRALQQARGQERTEILGALGQTGGSQLIPVLHWVAAEETDPVVVNAAIDALGRMNSQAAVTALMALSVASGRRERCIAALSKLESSALEWLGTGLKDSNPQVRTAVVEALARMKTPEATAKLVTALSDPEPAVRLNAVQALANLGTWSGQAKLTELMRTDPDVTVRRAAGRALRTHSDQRPFPGN